MIVSPEKLGNMQYNYFTFSEQECSEPSNDVNQFLTQCSAQPLPRIGANFLIVNFLNSLTYL